MASLQKRPEVPASRRQRLVSVGPDGRRGGSVR